jgi:hypothetical protein
LNPGKVIDPNPMTEDSRLGTDYNPHNPDKLYFAYPEDKGTFVSSTMCAVSVALKVDCCT